MRPFSLLVKPASADCNLRCDYCFYLKKHALYPDQKIHRMSDQVLEQMIRTFMATPQPMHSFGWQGGEPTLMGVDFFRKVTNLQQKLGPPGGQVANGLQTNTTLINDDFASHLGKYKFLVGVSIDGPADIHDRHRVTADGRGSHEMVMRGVEHLRRHQVDYNILTLVNEANVHKPREIYHYLRDELGVLFHQYIECVETDADGNLAPFAINGREWGEFLCGIFDEWKKHDTRRVSVRLFDSIVGKMVDGTANRCSMARDCRQYLVVEHNGDIYPCDFFVDPEWKLGNIMANTWEEMLESPKYQAFGQRKANWNRECARCEFLEYCAGCCPKNRPNKGRDPTQLSHLCEGWKIFYRHALPTLRQLAAEVRRERQQARQPAPGRMPPRKAGRNDPCPCGSGRKYKKCCGR